MATVPDPQLDEDLGDRTAEAADHIVLLDR